MSRSFISSLPWRLYGGSGAALLDGEEYEDDFSGLLLQAYSLTR
jgi:hypothetical protein